MPKPVGFVKDLPYRVEMNNRKRQKCSQYTENMDLSFSALKYGAEKVNEQHQGYRQTYEDQRIIPDQKIKIPWLSQQYHVQERKRRVRDQKITSFRDSLIGISKGIKSDREQKNGCHHRGKSCSEDISDTYSGSFFQRYLKFKHPYAQVQKTCYACHVSYIVIRDKQYQQSDYQTRIPALLNEFLGKEQDQRQEHVSVKPHDIEDEEPGICRKCIHYSEYHGPYRFFVIEPFAEEQTHEPG